MGGGVKMVAIVLGWLGNLLGGPFAKAAVDAYSAKLSAENSKDAHTADLVARELAVEQREAELQTQIKLDAHGHWYAVENLFAYVLLIYFGKVYLWDAAFHLGTTDAVRGDTAQWAGLIVLFWFGKRGAENIVRILKR